MVAIAAPMPPRRSLDFQRFALKLNESGRKTFQERRFSACARDSKNGLGEAR
jgi:hypothetical protein